MKALTCTGQTSSNSSMCRSIMKYRSVVLLTLFIVFGQTAFSRNSLVHNTADSCICIKKPADTGTNANPKSSVLAGAIVSIKNMRSKKDSARIDEIIEIKVVTYKSLDSLTTLYIDGKKILGLTGRPDKNDQAIYFELNEGVQDTLDRYLKGFPFSKSIVPVVFSLGNTNKPLIRSKDPFYIEVRHKMPLFYILLITILIAVLAGAALFKNALKDETDLYYSLARVQMFYWTILVVAAYLHICFTTGAIPAISNSILVILGISIATTAAARLVDNNRDGAPINPNAKSEGLLVDILSDGTGINIQRFQNVVFNVFFGVLFIQRATSTHIMPDFDDNALLLMGISATTYAGLKTMEDKKPQNQSPALADPGKPIDEPEDTKTKI